MKKKKDVLSPNTEALVKWLVHASLKGELDETSAWKASAEWTEKNGEARKLLDRAMNEVKTAQNYERLKRDYEAFKREAGE